MRSWTRLADDSGWQLSNVDSTKVGSFLLTHFPTDGKLLELPGNATKLTDCVNVMSLYKNAEGSLGERATLLHGASAAGAMRRSGIAFKAVANGGLTRAVGEPLEIELSATGLGADDALSARLEVFASSYTGLASAQLGAQPFDALPARLEVSAEAYKDHLADTSFCTRASAEPEHTLSRSPSAFSELAPSVSQASRCART